MRNARRRPVIHARRVARLWSGGRVLPARDSAAPPPSVGSEPEPIPSSTADYSALILPAMLKIGMYIAMSTTPTVPPMPTMRTGSMRLVSDATATSTSSS